MNDPHNPPAAPQEAHQEPRPVHTSPEVALAVTLAALALYDDRSTFVHYAEDDAFSVDPDFDEVTL